MPIALLAVIGLVAISVSRTFLAVSHSAAWVVGIVAALAVFVGAMILAAAPKLSKKATMAVAAIGAVCILAMGAYGLAKGKYEGHKEGGAEHSAESGETHSSEGGSNTESGTETGAVEGAAEPGAEETP